MKHTIKFLSLALCAAVLLSIPALAAETAPSAPDSAVATAAEPAAEPAVQVWGNVTKQENGSLLLNNADPASPNQEIMIHLPDGVPYVDSATGDPMDITQIKDGDTICVWIGPAMTMSLPPQTTAAVVVGNVPANGDAPQYAEVTAPAIFPAPGGTERRIPIAGGELTVLDAAEIKPYRTKNIVTLDSLTPGAQLLAWTGDDGKVDRILLFPYAYSGYLTADASGAVRLDGEMLDVRGRVIHSEGMDQLYLPLRAAAEAAGYEVDWVSGKGAVVSEYGTELFSVLPGSDTAQTADGEHGLLGGCVVDQGVTYLPARDLADLLHLYFYTA